MYGFVHVFRIVTVNLTLVLPQMLTTKKLYRLSPTIDEFLKIIVTPVGLYTHNLVFPLGKWSIVAVARTF